MLKTLNLLRLAQNYTFPFVRKVTSTNFVEIMDKAVEEQTVLKKEDKQERHKGKRERYNGKTKRRDWAPETEEAKKARLENPVERVKRRKALVLMGYSGVNYSGMQRNPDVPTIEEELLKAMLKHDWINEEGFKSPQQAFFQRAARTDKGVSAARQVVSLKLPETVDIDAINKDLPSEIKIFAVKKVTKGFNSKTTCDARSYSYTLPTFAFVKSGEEFTATTFRLSPERLEELNKVLGMYVGTKNYHNFTIKKEAHDASAKRFIMSFECQNPFIPDNTEVEFARLKITGQSFMMHQIRKMVGLVIAIMQGFVDFEIINRAIEKERMIIPQAPGLGLVLDNVHYPRYNERYGSDGVHEQLLFEEEDDAIEEFFRENIMTTIIETELRDNPMTDWIARLKRHSYDPLSRDEQAEKETSDKDGYNSD